jgi:malate dehydrogenase (oxaloacetate-decarboxylating)(NADP+)
MNYLMLPGTFAVHLRYARQREPDAEEIAEMTLMAAEQVKRFGIHPKGRAAVALQFRFQQFRISQEDEPCATGVAPCRPANSKLTAKCTATRLSEDIRREANPDSPLKGEANLLVMPNIDAANIPTT